ncbi:MAG: hypothetical protein P8184_08160 [Calditrichia bacterium]
MTSSRDDKIRAIKMGVLLIASIALINLFISGCAGTRLKTIKKLYEEDKYKEVVDSDIDCSNSSEKCFQIKLIRAESFYRLGDNKNALINSREAIHRLKPGISSLDVRRLYSLEASILFREYELSNDYHRKKILAENIWQDLDRALMANKEIPNRKRNEEKDLNLHLFAAEAVILNMDYVRQDSLDSLFDRLSVISARLGELAPEQGYEEFYLLQGRFGVILPEIKQLFTGGEGDRLNLLEEIKQIYRRGLQLRNYPIYQEGYAEDIEHFLKEVDQYMRQLVL